MTCAPLSLLLHAGMTFCFSGMSFTMLFGQASTQAPHPTQLPMDLAVVRLLAEETV